jgi:hypothetical protein
MGVLVAIVQKVTLRTVPIKPDENQAPEPLEISLKNSVPDRA